MSQLDEKQLQDALKQSEANWERHKPLIYGGIIAAVVIIAIIGIVIVKAGHGSSGGVTASAMTCEKFVQLSRAEQIKAVQKLDGAANKVPSALNGLAAQVNYNCGSMHDKSVPISSIAY